MFKPKTERIKKLAALFSKRIKELNGFFAGPTNIYIDWANVFRWQDKLGWHIDVSRLKQFLDSFSDTQEVKFYNGTLDGDAKSEELMESVKALGFKMRTKPVKIMKISIDASSVPLNSPALLENFIKKSLLRKLDVGTIESLNKKLLELNRKGDLFIEDRKCNFDVEIGRDMLLDYERNGIENYILWSGDSDFVDPIHQLLQDNKKVVIFATARRVSRELSEIGMPIFDIAKIREFICWSREIPQDIRGKIV